MFLQEILHLGAADHDPGHGVEHVAQPIVRERDRAAYPAVGGEDDELDGHVRMLPVRSRARQRPVRPVRARDPS